MNPLTPVNASDYGMVGDGVTDNTAAFQTALSAAASHPTRTLVIPSTSGTYNFGGKVTVPPGITVRGQSTPGDTGGYTPWVGNPWKVRLKWTGGYDTAIYCPQVSSNAFYDFELDGNSSKGTGLMLGNTTRISGTTNGTTTITGVTNPSAMPILPGMSIDSTWLQFGDILPGTTVVSYNQTTGVLVISNAATGSHAADPFNSYFAISDSAYPNGTNYPHFGGQRAILEGVYIHDFGVALGATYLDGPYVQKCYLGNSSIANVVLGLVFDSKFAYSYIGGNDFLPYPAAYGIYSTGTGDGTILENLQINQVGMAIWGANTDILANGLAFENVGTPTSPQIDLYAHSSLTGSNFGQILPPAGAVPIRLDLGSKCSHNCKGLFGHGPNVQATSHETTTLDGISNTSQIFVGNAALGSGIPALTFVTAVAAHSVTLSQSTTTSETGGVDFFPAMIQAVSEEDVNVPDRFPFRPIAIIDGATQAVTSIITNGMSATIITHGTLGSAVIVP